MRFARVILLLVSLVAGLAPPAGASHTPGSSLIARHDLAANGWAAYRVSIAEPATRVDLEVETSLRGQPVVVAGWAQRASGQSESYFLHTASRRDRYVHAELAGSRVVDIRRDGLRERDTFTFLQLFGPGEYVFLLAAASTGELSSRFGVYASKPVTVVATTSGGGAFVYLTPDFTGAANVSADASGASARAIAQASASTTAEASLFAWFIDFRTFPTLTEMSYEGPDGGGSGNSLYRIHGGPPGEYRFRIDYSAGAAADDVEIIAMGADVTLP